MVPKAALSMVTIYLCVQSTLSQYGTPPYCLLHALDVVPCDYRNPTSTDKPEANEYGNYSTKIKFGATGLPECQIRRKNHKVQPIATLPGDDRVKFIYSPGINLEPPEAYGNQIIVLYNISCPADHIAFYNISFIDMEDSNCYDPNLGTTRCVDYVQVIRPGTGITEDCGDEVSQDNIDQLEQGDFQVILRTSDTARFSGFQGTIVCFKTENANLPGCTGDSGGYKRRKRTEDSLDTFNEMYEKEEAQVIQLRTRQTASVSSFTVNTLKQDSTVTLAQRTPEDDLRQDSNLNPKYRLLQLVIPHRIHVVFEKNTISLCDSRNNRTKEQIRNVFSLYTFDKRGYISKFTEGAISKVDWYPIVFRGPGILRIAGRKAFFILFVIDPRGIFPNHAELEAIYRLSWAQNSLIKEDESNRIPQSILNPKPILYPENTIKTRTSTDYNSKTLLSKRDAGSSGISDEELIEAILNENACNPVLKTAAQATLNYVLQQPGGPERIQALRDQLSTPTSTIDSPVTTLSNSLSITPSPSMAMSTTLQPTTSTSVGGLSATGTPLPTGLSTAGTLSATGTPLPTGLSATGTPLPTGLSTAGTPLPTTTTGTPIPTTSTVYY